MILTPYLLFLFCVIVAAFVVLSARKRREEPSLRVVFCPETREAERVELDTHHSLVSFFRGHREVSLKSCSRWPERAGCDEECLAQIEPQLKVDGILAKWYDGKNCAMCSMPLVRADWQRGQAAALDENHRTVALRNMDWTQFPIVLDRYEPLCRKCHESQVAQRRAATA